MSTTAKATALEKDADMVNKEDRKRPLEEGDGNADDQQNQQRERTAITMDGEMPQKKFYRQRAHCNPLSHNDSFDYPIRPDLMDWSPHYPESKLAPTVLDIGCGFGGLTMALAPLLPDERILGMEIRAKVTEFVRLRILAHRKETPGSFQNASVMRTNSMKYLVNYFAKASISKLFFCFPDPHFKRKNWGRRIVTTRLLSEYAYVLKTGSRLYCITDVKELHDWHVRECDAHPLFIRLADDVISSDPCVEAMQVETEEGKKVSRNGGSKYYAVYERIQRAEVELSSVDEFFAEDGNKQ